MIYDETNYPMDTISLIENDIINFNYSGIYKEIILHTGNYKIECWGAQGGGKGGYTSGVVAIHGKQTLYVYTGQKGDSANNPNKTFNGGGGVYNIGYGPMRGGGASDVRLTSGAWNDTTSLRSRIMVAGGGGGTGSSYSGPGGPGGGLNGGDASPLSSSAHTGAKGATQISGGKGAVPTSSDTSGGRYGSGFNGQFGVGGDGGPTTSVSSGSGGGGGYYGGGGGCHTGGTVSSGSGGSSFISGLSGCNAINANGSHTGQSIHFSGLYFTECITQSDIREGNGLIKITVLKKMKRSLYFLKNDNNIEFKENSMIQQLNKTVNTITTTDFYNYGMDQQEWGGGLPQEFLFASADDDKATYKFLCSTIIYNKNTIQLIPRINIIKIDVVDNKNSNDIKYLINNGENWYSYKNNKWNVISDINIASVFGQGMSSSEISNLSQDNYRLIFNNEINQNINFCACLTSNEYDPKISIEKIILTYSKTGRKKVKDYNYGIVEYYNKIEVEWKTSNKKQIILLL